MVDVPAGAPWWIVLLGFLATVVMNYMNSRSVKAGQEQQSEQIDKVHEQVANTHSTNLRDDLDALRDDLKDFRTEYREDMSSIRERLRDVERPRG